MKRYHVLAFVTALAMLAPAVVSAFGLPGPIVNCSGAMDAGGQHACTCQDLITTAQNILYTGIYLAVFFSAVFFAWAGWKMLSGRTMGDSGSIEDAKKILWNVIIGLVIILAAWLIVNTLFTTLVSSKGVGSFCKMN